MTAVVAQVLGGIDPKKPGYSAWDVEVDVGLELRLGVSGRI